MSGRPFLGLATPLEKLSVHEPQQQSPTPRNVLTTGTLPGYSDAMKKRWAIKTTDSKTVATFYSRWGANRMRLDLEKLEDICEDIVWEYGEEIGEGPYVRAPFWLERIR
jgi:hypothetical protein